MNAALKPHLNSEPPPASTAGKSRRPKHKHAARNDLRLSTNYEEWAEQARALDELSGRAKWRVREPSNLYDHAMIRARLDQLVALRAAGDSHGLVFAIEEGVHGNLGGMGKPVLHTKAYFGTKALISDFVDTVCDTLLHIESLPEHEVPEAVKLDLFRRASHCYGRSALMMSSGGMLMFFHFG
ncbi:DUF3336 domain-containing protein, partial [uncultured Nevskia sp.]|uniref:DUF3336 domain-containing protein n=1 Tax=uncultured Nevskia sp. TaxID=228950 RepID=UPI0025F1FE3E